MIPFYLKNLQRNAMVSLKSTQRADSVTHEIVPSEMEFCGCLEISYLKIHAILVSMNLATRDVLYPNVSTQDRALCASNSSQVSVKISDYFTASSGSLFPLSPNAHSPNRSYDFGTNSVLSDVHHSVPFRIASLPVTARESGISV